MAKTQADIQLGAVSISGRGEPPESEPITAFFLLVTNNARTVMCNGEFEMENMNMDIINTDICMGFAEEDITPVEPLEMVGFSRPDNMSKGVLHKLLAQVAVWKAPDAKCCLVAVDSLGFTVELANLLRDGIAAELKTVREKVMICFSHTHSAPNAGTSDDYYNFVCRRIISAVKRADGDAVPVKAAWGVAKNDIGVNRRGCIDSIDDRLGVLKVTGLDHNDLKLLLLRVTAHPNVLTSDNYMISSDYFGVARDLIEKKYGCNVILIQGAAGDIRPKYQQENAEYLEVHSFEAAQREIPESEKELNFSQSMQALDNMADAIYKSLDMVFDSLTPEPVTTLSMFSVERRFFADVPDMEKAVAIADEAKKAAGIDGAGWLNEVKTLQSGNIKQQICDIEIQYFILNRGCVCGVPNEVMSSIALDVSNEGGTPFIFFNGYTNGCNSYLPTAEEYDKGGFEVFWSNLIYYQYHGRVMPLNRDTARLLTDDAVRCWKRFFGENLR